MEKKKKFSVCHVKKKMPISLKLERLNVNSMLSKSETKQSREEKVELKKGTGHTARHRFWLNF